jgi:pteridine reductase
MAGAKSNRLALLRAMLLAMVGRTMDPSSGPDAGASAAKVALVTGAAVRVGRAIAIRLAEAGHRVWLHCHLSHEQARELAGELGERALGVIAADLADPHARARLCATVLDPAGPAGGRIDLLVCSAASFERGAFVDRTDADLERVLRTNLVAPLSLARALAGALAQRTGAIVNVGDVAGVHPWRGQLDHCTSKAALHFATRALALELAPVRVNAVAPGTVAWPDDALHAEGSPLRDAVVAAIPLSRIGTPRDVADAVLFLAEAPYVTGTILPVDGGRLAAAVARPAGDR